MATDSSGKLIPDNTLAAQLAATAVPPVKKPVTSFGPPTGAAAIALAPKPSAPAAAATTDTTTTPAAPAPAAPAPAPSAPAPAGQTQSPTGVLSGLTPAQQAGFGPTGPAINELLANYAVTQAAKSPQQLLIDKQNAAIRQQAMQQPRSSGGFGQSPGGAFNPSPAGYSIPLYG